MKDAIIVKLANQAADYFGDAFKQCQYKDTLPKVSYYLCEHLLILHVKYLDIVVDKKQVEKNYVL